MSIILFFCDYRFNLLDKLRTNLSTIIIPVQYVINWPIESTQKISQNFANKKNLLEENNRLQNELLLLNAKLQQLDFLEYENSKLRSLLNHSKQIQNKIVPAKTISPLINNFGQQITINKGKRHNTYISQPVLDATGLVGQVISNQDQTSQVLLINNIKSAIPAMIVRNGLQTIALGTGGNNLKLANIPETADVKTGDFIVTSSLGEHFPAGYHVGTIKEVNRVLGERFMQVSVKPKANINEILHVLLIWPDTNYDEINKLR